MNDDVPTLDRPARGPRARARHHDWIDERSRALDEAVVEKLHQDPSLVRRAWENLDRWEIQRGPHPVFEEWRSILRELHGEDLYRFLTEDSEHANRLRQSSPFAGILSQEERIAVFRRYEAL